MQYVQNGLNIYLTNGLKNNICQNFIPKNMINLKIIADRDRNCLIDKNNLFICHYHVQE